MSNSLTATSNTQRLRDDSNGHTVTKILQAQESSHGEARSGESTPSPPHEQPLAALQDLAPEDTEMQDMEFPDVRIYEVTKRELLEAVEGVSQGRIKAIRQVDAKTEFEIITLTRIE